ncbi:hybrid sensor histidine kinase/response regulator [Massilia eurypsychrophila]|uniref:Virulence sensor protein BvgS n=1 Tax=Massilia eurypsychrophila TaxID=1485217 RepID=A0A2G8TAF7_9BURK|nr:response regulator [Massilia eurypsychrophila]PIL42668.1 hybrid sensor histidine kinase/response regulator [Massilia eurypsychrophila]
MNLLIVDDTPTNLKLLRAQLEAEGHAVFEAHHGVDALALLERQRVDAVISDILMPHMDGFRLCYEIRKHAHLHDLPIIIYSSTYISPADEKLIFDVGADKYIRKPVSLKTIVAALHEAIAMPHAAPRPEALQEVEVLKEHSERLVSKLEEKNTEFQAQTAALTAEIAERKRAEEALLKAGALQSAIFNSANFSSIATDASGVIQIFNVGAERMLGYTAAEVMNKITPADISDPQEVIARAQALSLELETSIAPGFDALVFKASRGIEDIYELTYIRKDGSRFPAVVSVTALRDAPGGIIGYLLIGTDNTARKRAEEALLKASALHERRVAGIVDSAMDAVISIDDEQRIVLFNAAAEKMFACPSAQALGQTLERFVPVRSRAAHAGHVHAFGRAGIRVTSRSMRSQEALMALRADGTEFPIEAAISQIEVGGQKLYTVILRDITERKQYEESLREASHNAEQASRAKSEFLANMSHEIRTPLGTVTLLCYLLERTSLNEQQVGYLAKIKLASKSLLEILNNVLDLSKIEAGELIAERATFSLRSLLNELTDVMAVHAEGKAIAFEIDAPDDLPGVLEGDATRLKQILTNLLSNAIKFTERGGVKLRIRRLAATSTHITLSFVVQDTGIGIAPEVRARLFAPFAQADSSITRRFGGTGLGLSIVQRLVKLMGGEVGLDSTPGAGSEFRVVLDFAMAAPEALARLAVSSAAPGEHALLGVRILVVDDSTINRDGTKYILELEGAQVWLASNGQEAFDRLQAEPRAFDVVLMDLQMPVLDGHEATRRIRLELGLADLPIIAVTADALRSQRQRATAAGMNDYIVKPFDAPALVSSILRHVKPTRDRLIRQLEGIDLSDARARLIA